MRSLRIAGLAVVTTIALLLVFAVGVFAAPVGDPARLVFLLEYVGTDYGQAVRDGKVVDENEYGEVLRFVHDVIRGYEAQAGRTEGVGPGLHALEQRIAARAPADEVWAATRKLVPGLARALGSAVRPATVPNVASGRRLWVNDCAPCHGPGGGGDGADAAGMTPPPTAFRGDTFERLSPRQIFDAVTFGVDGTAMPSFSAAYSERERWDVAFFLVTLRVESDPQRPPADVRLTLDDLAASSNAELLARLRRPHADATVGEVDWLRRNFASSRSGVTAPAGTPAGADGLGIALQLQDVFAGVAAHILPRVVGVTAYARDPDWSPEALRTRHGDGWMGEHPEATRYPGFRPAKTGSGFVVDAQGYALACDHTVRDEHGEVMPFVDVELQDQSHLAARVVGAEPTLDLAVLQVGDASRLGAAAAEMDVADSDHVELGQWLIALGDPPGPAKTITVGLVSAAPERQCYQEALSATRLQSSLVVPAEGLGGPVVDVHGRVVGMTVRQADASAVGAADGPPATHVLPVNLVLNLYEALKVAQSRRSPWLGVSVLELPTLRQKLGPDAVLPQTGIYIDDVFDPSPASRAGVRPGDFLLALGGHPILAVGDFQTWLYVLGPGTATELDLQRDGQPLHVQATIEVRPGDATTR